MMEPTIICPKCKSEIKLTESLAAPLIEATRKQYEDQLSRKGSDTVIGSDYIRARNGLLFAFEEMTCN